MLRSLPHRRVKFPVMPFCRSLSSVPEPVPLPSLAALPGNLAVAWLPPFLFSLSVFASF